METSKIDEAVSDQIFERKLRYRIKVFVFDIAQNLCY